MKDLILRKYHFTYFNIFNIRDVRCVRKYTKYFFLMYVPGVHIPPTEFLRGDPT